MLAQRWRPSLGQQGQPPVLHLHHGLDAAADVEVAFDVEVARVERGDEIVGDPVRDRLVERPFVAIRPEIELQRLQLDALLVRDVADADRGEVRLRRHRTEAGELRRLEGDLVIAFGIRDWERFRVVATVWTA